MGRRGAMAVVAAAMLAVVCSGSSSVGAAQAVQAPRDFPHPQSFTPLVEAVKSAVVNVSVQQRGMEGLEGLDLFERFFGAPPGSSQIRLGTGSGFIIREDGLVLTNSHVVEGALSIRVQLDDRRTFEAKVLGRDPLTDLALLELQGEVGRLPVVQLGDSEKMRVGDWVMAIGNPFGLASSVSAGIISARARDIQVGPFDDFFQTDAAINPGNSGGPLFNMHGEVIGINTAIVGGGAGIGFAVPSNMAKFLLPQLEKGVIHRGWLGLAVQDLTPELARALGVSAERGAVVAEVSAGTPAAKAGLEEKDVVVAIEGQPVESARALTRTVGFRKPGESVRLQVYRGGKLREVQVRLGERPDLEGVQTPLPEVQGELQSQKLGMKVQDVDARSGRAPGALITDVVPGSVADRMELYPGMVVIEADGKPVRSAKDLMRILQKAKRGASILLRVEADGQRLLRAVPVP
ncbi:MAG: Do family serine endopeptidase [Myxococcota bacterium]